MKKKLHKAKFLETEILEKIKFNDFSFMKKLQEKQFKRYYPELYKKIISKTEGSCFREKLFLINNFQLKCKNCFLNKTKFCEPYMRYKDFCSTKCSNSNIELCKQKTLANQKTCLEHFGVDNYRKTDAFKRTSKDAKIKKYGENYGAVMMKMQSEKKGVKNISQLDSTKKAVKNTSLKKYGYESHTQRPEERKRLSQRMKSTTEYGFGTAGYKKSMLKIHGAENPAQVIEIFEKRLHSACKYKSYILPSGKTIKIQGFENFVLDYIFKNNLYLEDEILINNREIENEIGKIYYEFEGKVKRYYPDFYIKKERKIIEVKSEYTFTFTKEKNNKKVKACKQLGFLFEIIIFDRSKQKIITKKHF